MSKHLLIGNGFNLACGIKSLSNNMIIQRFVDVLIRTSIIYQSLFNVSFTNGLCKDYIVKNDNNIEKIADNLFHYIKSKNEYDNSLNLKMDILDIIKISALNAIFVEKNHFIKLHCLQENNTKIFNIINQYDNIFSLNYYNEWDENIKYIYLHGKFFNNIINNKSSDKPILLYDEVLYKSFDKYYKAINDLKDKNSIYPIDNPRSIVFSPVFLRKQEAVNFDIYPSEYSYPSNHSFPAEPIMLYTELSDLHEIDVFGTSPYGDQDLIDKLKEIGKGTIYIFDKEEKAVWNNKLQGINFIYKESNEFYDNR